MRRITVAGVAGPWLGLDYARIAAEALADDVRVGGLHVRDLFLNVGGRLATVWAVAHRPSRFRFLTVFMIDSMRAKSGTYGSEVALPRCLQAAVEHQEVALHTVQRQAALGHERLGVGHAHEDLAVLQRVDARLHQPVDVHDELLAAEVRLPARSAGAALSLLELLKRVAAVGLEHPRRQEGVAVAREHLALVGDDLRLGPEHLQHARVRRRRQSAELRKLVDHEVGVLAVHGLLRRVQAVQRLGATGVDAPVVEVGVLALGAVGVRAHERDEDRLAVHVHVDGGVVGRAGIEPALLALSRHRVCSHPTPRAPRPRCRRGGT